MLITVSACAVSSTAAPDFCTLYQPVPTLHAGTKVQQLMTDENNAVYMEKCR